MSKDRLSQHAPSVARKTAALVAPARVGHSTAQMLQRRLGNSGAQQLGQQLVRQNAPGSSPQTRLNVSSPSDPAELEAVRLGQQIARMPAPNHTPAVQQAGLMRNIARRENASPPAMDAEIQADIGKQAGGGMSLPERIRHFMEVRFGANFSKVRIHTDDRAARLAKKLGAQAFTVGPDVFFDKGQFQPDSMEGKELLAHELTHTIQQGAASQTAPPPPPPEPAPPAASATVALAPPAPAAPALASVTPALAPAPAIQQRESATVARASSGAGRVLDFFAGKANLLPGFRFLTLILGLNPINLASVPRSAANILRALIELIPGASLLTGVLANHGIFERAAGWVQQQFAALGMGVASFTQALERFIDSAKWHDIFNWDGVWERAKAIFSEPIDRLLNTGHRLVDGMVDLVKQTILLPLANMAKTTRGYDLLCAVLGRDPISGQSVTRNASTLISGFMQLIGQQEVWENIRRANAVGRAWAWFQGALHDVSGLVADLPNRFVAALRALSIADLVSIVGAFGKLISVLGGFVGDFLVWSGKTVWNLLEIIFEVVAPGAMPYLKKTGAALKEIFKNPLPFVRNLARAGKLGFQQFAQNIGSHLRTSLIEWLTGSLPGVYIPQTLNLQEILKFTLSVLGISWANIRAKLVRVVGETAVTILENSFELVKILVTQGPAAAWDNIKEHLGNLRDTVIGGITEFVSTTIVTRASAKIASLLIPGAGFISAIVSIYDMIKVFINQMARIAQVGKAFLDSVTDIAAGAIGNAAGKVETTLAGLITLALNFLAGFVGLGGVSAKVMSLINTKVRVPIDKALDKLVEWIVKAGSKLISGSKPPAATEAAATATATPATDQDSMTIEQILAEPPGTTERDDRQKRIELAQVGKLIDRIAKNCLTTEHMAAYFPRLTTRFRLSELKYVIVQGKLKLHYQINPDDYSEIKLEIQGTKYLDGLTTKIGFEPGNIGTTTVGGTMVANPLGVEHPQGTHTSGGQKAVMDRLPIAGKKGVPSEDGYIRGHLLNAALGGKGEDRNLFPITGKANSQHENNVETHVKKWVNEDKLWVYYAVEVKKTGEDLSNSIVENNFVDATLKCHAYIIGTNNTNYNEFKLDIESKHGQTINVTAPTIIPTKELPISAGPEANTHTPLKPPGQKYILNAGIYATYSQCKGADGNIDKKIIKKAVDAVPNMGKVAVAVLLKFLDKAQGTDIEADLPGTGEKSMATELNNNEAALIESLKKNHPGSSP